MDTFPQSSEGINVTTKQDARPAVLFGQAGVSLDALSAAFHGLGAKTMQPGAEVAQSDAKDATDLRQDIEEQKIRHEEGLAEIRAIIDELLNKEALANLRAQIEKEISLHIDEIVQNQVAECLKQHMPKDLQLEVEEGKQELERARLSLHNSESRRINGMLRSQNLDDRLDTLLKSDGTVSAHFPKDLRALFSMDAETCRAFSVDYNISQISDNRDKNLNKIMQFVGVRYQMILSSLDDARK